MNNSSRLSRLFFLFLAVAFSLLSLTACHRKAVPLIKHAPVQNPQGIAFTTDPSFVKAYNQYLTNKARLEQASHGSTENSNAEASIYNIKNIDNLRGAKIINPTEANWNINYIAPQERHVDKAIKKLKNFMDTGMQNVKNIVASPNSTNTTGDNRDSNNKNRNTNNNSSRVIGNNNDNNRNNKISHSASAYNRNNNLHNMENIGAKTHIEKQPYINKNINKKNKNSFGHPAHVNKNRDNNIRGGTSFAKNEKANINISKPHASIKQAMEKKSWQPWHEAAVKNSEFFRPKKKLEPKLMKSSSNNEVLDLKKEFTSLKTETGKRIVDCRHGKEIIAKKIKGQFKLCAI